MDQTDLPAGVAEAAVRVARLSFPHDVPADVYETAAREALQANADPITRSRVVRGLEHAAGLSADAELLRWLEAESDEPWFRAFRQLVLPGVYGHPQVWALIGYQGPSFDLGGYLHRGFDDLDWLPDPRVQEAGTPLAEIGPGAEK
jgi:hypothetical protein